MDANSFFLSQSDDTKVKFLRDALEEDNFGMFVQLSRIVLDAPLNRGGLPTETVEQIHNEYLIKHGSQPM